MDRLNQRIENQIKSWIFQMEHTEMSGGMTSIYVPFDAYRLPTLPPKEN